MSDLLPDGDGSDVGCGGHLITTLVRALVARGHRVSVITLSPSIEAPQVLAGPSLTYYVYPMRTRRRMRDLFALERRWLVTGLHCASPDVIHAHWTYEWAMASLETHLPTLVTTHDDGVRQLLYSRDLYRLGRLYMQVRVLREARFLTAVSPYLARATRRFTRAPIEVVPNPIAVPQGSDNGSERRSHTVKVVTVLNGWGRRKNATTAIRAFQLLRRNLSAVEMWMYGEDYDEQGPAARWAAAHGLHRNICFRGPVPHRTLLAELGGANVLLHPALEESFGMAIVEAMSLGVPVVAGNAAGGVPWVLDDGQAGYLTDVREPATIADALLSCIADPCERERRSKNAYERVLNFFSADAVAAQYEAIYARVMAAAS